jgi:hypothetical protein
MQNKKRKYPYHQFDNKSITFFHIPQKKKKINKRIVKILLSTTEPRVLVF